MVRVYHHEDWYFEKTPIEKHRICCNCRNRTRKDTCNIDGHRIGYIECFECWCKHWAGEKNNESM